MGMMLQAWHTCIWGASPILLCRVLSGCMGSVAAQLFSGLSVDVQVLALARPLKDIQRLVLKQLLRCLGCVLRVNCPIGRWTFAPVWGPECSGASFHQGSLCTLICSSLYRSWLVSQSLLLKYPYSMMLPPPCFTVGMVPGFLQTWRLEFRPKNQARESCFSSGLSL